MAKPKGKKAAKPLRVDGAPKPAPLPADATAGATAVDLDLVEASVEAEVDAIVKEEIEWMTRELGIIPLADVPEGSLRGGAVDVQIDRMLERVADVNDEAARLQMVYRARMEMMQSALDEQLTVLARRRGFYEEQLRLIALAYDMKGKKSVSFPHGVIGFRAKRTTVELVDADAALAFAKEHSIEYKVTESLNKTPVIEFIKSRLAGQWEINGDGDLVNPANGDIIELSAAGIRWVDEQPNDGRGEFNVEAQAV